MSEFNWFYVEDGEQAGPVGEVALRSLIRNGHIQPDTLVWHEGMPEWQKAKDTEIKNLLQLPAPTSIPTIPEQPLPPPSFSAKSLHTLWLWLTGLTVASIPLSQLLVTKTSKTTASSVILILAVIISIILYTLLYRFWSLIQGPQARTTPIKAVLLCLIPFYNIYWNYIAYVGLAEDMNSFCDTHKIQGERVSRILAQVWYMLWLFVMILIISGASSSPLAAQIGLPMIVVQIVLTRQFVRVSATIISACEKN